MKHLIIGAGSAGVRATETPRARCPHHTGGRRAGRALFAHGNPYILNGAIDEDGARQRRSRQHLASLSIQYLNARAMQVNPGPSGGQVTLDDGTQLEYDRLLRCHRLHHPHCPPIPGTESDVVTCWTLDDARRIAAKLKPGARVVMLGAGFVAGVCMKSLVNSGARLSVVAGRSGQILRSMMTPVGSGLLQRWSGGARCGCHHHGAHVAH